MRLKHRIKKLESKTNIKACFCGKTLVDLWYGKPGASPLTYCANCKEQYDFWARLAREAKEILSANLTDFNK